MKTRILPILTAILFVLVAPAITQPALATASCTGVPISGGWTLLGQTCQFPDTTFDGLVDSCVANAAVLTIGATGSLSIATGQTVAVGSVDVSAAGGSIVINPGGTLALNTAIYATDADNDGYPAYGSHFASSGTKCRTTETDMTNYDCGDSSAAAHPGQNVAQSGSFTNTQNAALTHDWDCNGTESKTYPAAGYSCAACTNGSGYASSINSAGGFAAVPACGVAGTYYTITNATCQDPAVASCTGAYTTSSVTQTCL